MKNDFVSKEIIPPFLNFRFYGSVQVETPHKIKNDLKYSFPVFRIVDFNYKVLIFLRQQRC
jgi:hypothetical protein